MREIVSYLAILNKFLTRALGTQAAFEEDLVADLRFSTYRFIFRLVNV